MTFISALLNAQPYGPESEVNQQGRWEWWQEGVCCFIPHQQVDQSLVISAGIHGNETAPVEILATLLEQLLAGEISVNWRLLVIIGNPQALRAQKRYLEVDLNRLFGRRWQSQPASPEAQLAESLEKMLERFWPHQSDSRRWHLDMHTAIRDSYHRRFAVLPARTAPFEPQFMTWLAGAGLEALVFHKQPAGTFSHYSSECFSANSCTLELGKARPFGANQLGDFSQTQQALRALISGDLKKHSPGTPICYQVSQQILRCGEGFILHIPNDVMNFTPFLQGELLAETPEQQIRVIQPREFVLFPNPNVAFGLRAALMLEAIEMP